MSKSITLIAVFGFVAALSACAKAPEEEYVVVTPDPVSVEPTYTGKYK
jgi:hypothetical protein